MKRGWFPQIHSIDQSERCLNWLNPIEWTRLVGFQHLVKHTFFLYNSNQIALHSLLNQILPPRLPNWLKLMIIYVKMDTEHTRGVPKLKALGAEIAFPAGGPRRQYKSLQFPVPLHRKCKRFPPKKSAGEGWWKASPVFHHPADVLLSAPRRCVNKLIWIIFHQLSKHSGKQIIYTCAYQAGGRGFCALIAFREL